MRKRRCTTQHSSSYDALQFEIAYQMKEKWLFEYWPNFAQKSRVVKTVIFPQMFQRASPSFSQLTCQIGATEGTENFVLIAYAVHELSQNSGRG